MPSLSAQLRTLEANPEADRAEVRRVMLLAANRLDTQDRLLERQRVKLQRLGKDIDDSIGKESTGA